MAQTIIDISTPNDGLGDPLRVAMDLQNGMNTELYNTKVDKVLGKELSSNDYTSAEKSKLAGIEAGAQVNVPADWNTLLNKPAELNNSVGYFYYDNTITALSFLAGVEKKLTNNKLGTETDVTHPPYGVTSFWDSTTNALDFSQLNVGDSVDLRLDSEITTTVNNQEVEVFLRVGIGTATEKDIVFNYSVSKVLGAQGSESSYVSFPIITEDVRDYPAELYVKSVDDGTILVGGFFIRAIRSGLNIIDVIVETDAPIDGVLYGRKDESWEAVPVYVAGTNITIDDTDPLNPVISASGGGGGATLGLIKIVDKAGDFFTDLATASAYIRTFTSATITDESYSNGTFWFTVPNGSSFGLTNEFLFSGSAYIEDVLGLISTFGNSAFQNSSGNNILGNCTFGGDAFRNSSGNNILENCTFFIDAFLNSSGNNILGNCTFGGNAFFGFTGINKIRNILMSLPTSSFAPFSSGRFEIYGNIGTTVGNDYINFFPTSTAVIWAQKSKETSNAGGIEGDLARAQTNGAKLFFGYANSGGGGGTQDLQSVTETGATTDRAITVQGVTISGNEANGVTNIGDLAGTSNTGDNVTNLGQYAGTSNALNNVINLGLSAQATATNQLALNTGIANTAINLPATATELRLRASASVESIAYLSDITAGSGDMTKAIYDTDDDGVVDSAKKEVVNFINKSGVRITKGTIVYIKSSSASATYPEVLKANATTEATSSKTIGAVFEDVEPDAVGYIVTSGEVRNLDTSAYVIGDKLWLSTTDGLVTTTVPTQPNHAVFIGTVTRAQSVNGRVLYAIQNGYEIEELHNFSDVSYGFPIDTDSLMIKDSGNSLWKRLTWSNLKAGLALFSFQKYIVKDSLPTSALTGTTALTQIGASILIPADTYGVLDAIVLESLGIAKTGTAGTCIWRLSHNTSDTLVGSTIIASANLLATQISGNMQRVFEINGGLLKCRLGGTNTGFTDKQASTAAGLSISFDPTVDNYFFRVATLSNAGDSVLSPQILILR